MNLIKLNILGISSSQVQNGTCVLILGEEKGSCKLPIVIGVFEAQAIAIALEKNLTPPRPLTHDLFEQFARHFDIIIQRVIIHKLVDGIFYSNIICKRDGIEEIFDARSSDAIALAVRFDAPIFIYDSVLLKADIPDENEDMDISKKDNPVDESLNLKNKLLKELNMILKTAIKTEDYEKAALIRDELNRRKDKKS